MTEENGKRLPEQIDNGYPYLLRASEDLEWIMDQENYTFAECTLAEQVMERVRNAQRSIQQFIEAPSPSGYDKEFLCKLGQLKGMAFVVKDIEGGRLSRALQEAIVIFERVGAMAGLRVPPEATS